MALSIFIMMGLVSCVIGAGVTGLEMKHVRAEQDSDCGPDAILKFNQTVDPDCEMNVGQLGELLVNATLGLVSADDLSDLADKVCSDTCIGAQYRFYTMCPLGNEDILTGIGVYVTFCSNNGDEICGLVPYELKDSDRQAYFGCLFNVLFNSSTDECPSGCKEAYDTVTTESGCCSSNLADLYFTIFNDNVEEFYSTCNIDAPKSCSNPYEDNGTTTVLPASTSMAILVTLVTTVFGML